MLGKIFLFRTKLYPIFLLSSVYRSSFLLYLSLLIRTLVAYGTKRSYWLIYVSDVVLFDDE